jgi:hypothetical protein
MNFAFLTKVHWKSLINFEIGYKIMSNHTPLFSVIEIT